jgi:hypothetical protein
MLLANAYRAKDILGGCSSWIRYAAAGLLVGVLAFASETRRIAISDWCITVPATTEAHLSEGPDFSVTYLNLSAPSASLGIYEGGYPSSFAPRAAVLAKERDSIGAIALEWQLWRDAASPDSTYGAETTFSAAATRFHLFIVAPTKDGLLAAQVVARTFRKSEPNEQIEHLPRPPPPPEPPPPPAKLNSSSPFGFRTGAVAIGPVQDQDLVYFLSHADIVARPPYLSEDRSVLDYKWSYRIFQATEQGNCVGGCPRSIILVAISNYSDDPNGILRCYRVEGTHFVSFLKVDEWKKEESDGYFLTFRFESEPTTDLSETYRVEVGSNGATIRKVGEKKDPHIIRN